jgi:RHS repeat-associated protein
MLAGFENIAPTAATLSAASTAHPGLRPQTPPRAFPNAAPTPGCTVDVTTLYCTVYVGIPYNYATTANNTDGGHGTDYDCGLLVFYPSDFQPPPEPAYVNPLGQPIGGLAPCTTQNSPFQWSIIGSTPVNTYQAVNVTYYTIQVCDLTGGNCNNGYWHWNNGIYVTVEPRPETACGRCNGTTIGRPIDVATGELWYEHPDFTAAGPFGLSFRRFYGSQTLGSADLGSTHWLHNYSARLDLTNSPNSVTYYDIEGMPYYFANVGTNVASYDNYTGMTLIKNADGSFTWKSFGSDVQTFNSSGQLAGLQDRIGNVQTVNRDSSHGNRISTVTDALGRALCFTYDANSRITSVGWASAVSQCIQAVPPLVTLTYDSGTNCATGDLCSVKEPDGNTWTYQYSVADPYYQTNLTAVVDQLGNTEESNVYSGDMVVQQTTGTCTSIPCADTGGYFKIAYPSSGTTVSITDGESRASTITYDPSSLLVTNVTGPVCGCGGDQTRNYTYDLFQRVTSVTDDGNHGDHPHTVSFAYQRDSTATPGPTTPAYPGPTQITENLENSGTTRITNISYFGVGTTLQDLPQVTTLPSVANSASNMSVTDTYAANGLLQQRATTGWLSAGQEATYSSSYTFDSRGRVKTATDARQHTTTFTYNPDNDANGYRRGQLWTIENPLNQTTTFASRSSYQYNLYGNPLSATDPNGRSWEFTYDGAGRTTSIDLVHDTWDPTDVTTTFSYDAAGRLTRVTKPVGNATAFYYDTSDRVKNVVRLDSAQNQHEQLAFTYNYNDELTVKSAQLCAAPAVTCSAWSTKWTQSFGYSNLDNLATVTNADGTTRQFGYQDQGELASVNDENHPTGLNYAYTWDLAGRMLTRTRALSSASGGSTTEAYKYDSHDNVTKVTDRNGNVSNYAYDDFDRLEQVVSPTTGTSTYAYDPTSNMLSTNDSNGNSATYAYDQLNRLMSESDSGPNGSLASSWSYDDSTPGNFGIGQVRTMSDPSGATSYTYSHEGFIGTEAHTYLGNPFTVSYAYDANGNRSNTTYPDGNLVQTGYDFADRPYSASLMTHLSSAQMKQLRSRAPYISGHIFEPEVSLAKIRRANGLFVSANSVKGPSASPGFRQPLRPRSEPSASPSRGTSLHGHAPAPQRAKPIGSVAQYVTASSYEPFGPLLSLAFGNGVNQTFSYNSRYLPTENKLTSSGTVLADYIYGEDPVGNILSITDGENAAFDRSFQYDDLNRITTANSGSSLWGTGSGNGYQYDPMGNILSLELGSAHKDTFSYKPGTSGSLGLPLIASVVENGSQRNVSYDPVGNELNDGVSAFTYSARELLGSDGLNISSYYYDGLRRRVGTTLLSNGKTRVSILDDSSHPLSESALTASAPPPINFDYIWFGGRPIAQVDSSGTHWNFGDLLGAPLIQTDINANVTYRAEYEPYGRIWSLRGSDVHQPLRLPGQTAEQFDNLANGLTERSYNNARWYAPAWGRYTQADPLGVASGPNEYSYAGSNPLESADPWGLCLVEVYYHHIENLVALPVPLPGMPGGTSLWIGRPLTWSFHGLLRVTNNMNPGAPSSGKPGPPDWSKSQMFDAEPSNGDQFDNWGSLKLTQMDWNGGPSTPQYAVRGAVYRTGSESGPIAVVNNAGPCGCYLRALNSVNDAVNLAKIPYNPVPEWDNPVSPYGNSNGGLWMWLQAINALGNGLPPGNKAPWALPGYQPLWPAEGSPFF